MARQKKSTLEKKYYSSFSGGLNSYIGVRQIKDNESPDMTNCDFLGKGGIGSRQGYSQVGTVGASASGIKGMGTLHTSTIHQALAFKSTGSAVVLSYSTGGAWTEVTGTTFADIDIDTCQAIGNTYACNGSNVMRHWTGSAWVATTNGTIGYYPTYYGNRLWVVDEQYPDRLNFSGQYGATDNAEAGGSAGDVAPVTTSKFADFSDGSAGWIAFKYGSGAEITGLKVFKGYLYVFLRDAIYKVSPASAVDTFLVSQVTSSVGCVSHRSVVQVEEDLYFASDDGVYSLGEVANYVSVRTTNKSAKIEKVFTGMTAANKAKVCAAYYNFKYHLFYSLFGTTNDSCVAYDVRYQGWVDWRNMPANSATVFIDSDGDRHLYFGHPTNSKVYDLDGSSDDDGTTITSTWYSKSFDSDLPDTQKVYFDHTFVFGALNGTVDITVRFNDTEVAGTKSLSQVTPQGGFGRDTFGLLPFGDATNTITIITNYRGVPVRMRVSKKKFAVQYKITSSGTWRLDNITTTFKPLSHYSFPSLYKI